MLKLVSLFCVLWLMGCSPVSFKVAEKQEVLKTSTILPSSPVAPVSNYPGVSFPIDGTVVNPIGSSGLPSNLPTGTGAPITGAPITGGTGTGGTSTGGRVEIPVQRQCSDIMTNDRGSHAMAAKTLTLEILNSAGSTICSETGTSQIKTDLREGKVRFSKCALTDGNYQIRLSTESGASLIILSDILTVQGSIVHSTIEVLVESNPQINGELPNGIPEFSNITCDLKASPLYIDFRLDSSKGEVLSSPSDGVLFDILGANNNPQYTPSQISWFRSAKFALLTLPNRDGKVLNIDQLFGDNTLGPDGKFTENGFLALAKYDDNKDGVIDSKDAVFSELRLWFDYDRNGKASDRELVKLKSRKIVLIDLNYDPNYYEKDQHGNEIKFKSVVQFENGKLRSIFDVWFKL